MLYDLKRYREYFDRKKIIEAISTICAGSILPDQDLLNLQFKGRIKNLDLRYNFQPIHIMFSSDIYLSYFKKDYYSKEQIDGASNNVVIFHAIRMFGNRPWDYDSKHPYKDLFEEYKRKSPWAEEVSTKKKKNIIHIVEFCLYRLLPKRLFFYIFYKIHKIEVLRELRERRKTISNN